MLRVSAIADVISCVDRGKWVNIITAALPFRKVKQKGKHRSLQPKSEVQHRLPTVMITETPRVFSIESDDSDSDMAKGVSGQAVDPDDGEDVDDDADQNMAVDEESDDAEVVLPDDAVEEDLGSWGDAGSDNGLD